jgi:hypothetical protein
MAVAADTILKQHLIDPETCIRRYLQRLRLLERAL